MVLRLRVDPEIWEAASDPALNETLQRLLNCRACRMFTQEDPLYDPSDGEWKYRGEYRMIATERVKLYLAQPTVPNAQWDFDIVFFRTATERDRRKAITGVEVKEEVIVLAPGRGLSVQQKSPVEDSSASGIDQATNQIIFLLKVPTYRQLPEHEREPVNMAWRQAKHGRTVRRVFWKEDAIFILTPDDTAPTNPNAAVHLNQALTETDTGRVITDPYEVRRALELANKFGTSFNGGITEGEQPQ